MFAWYYGPGFTVSFVHIMTRFVLKEGPAIVFMSLYVVDISFLDNREFPCKSLVTVHVKRKIEREIPNLIIFIQTFHYG